jgi:hypothetical protein
MSIKSKLIAAAAIATTVVASPAFAQEFVGSYGTGNVMSTYYDQNGALHLGAPQQNSRIAARRSGQSAFASVPRATLGTPAGGSVGYNENLRTDQW